MPVFKTSQLVKATAAECWNFFSNPVNLSKITPPEMNFRILFPVPVPEMYQGMIIQYKVSPLFNLPMEWITEISHVEKFRYFVDNQLHGPYKLWHHQHLFEETDAGILMTDIVTYKLPFGMPGAWIAGKFVAKKVEEIFNYRQRVIEEVFNKSSLNE